MNSVCVDIKQYLVDNGFSTQIEISKLPTEPTNCVGFFDTSGGEPGMTFNDSVNYRDGLQILVRNTSYEDAYTDANTLVELLNGVANETINSVKYLYIGLMSGPQRMTSGTGAPMDGDMTIFSINFQIKRTE